MRLAAPQRPWLVGGCLALLIRLPFSLAVPHFVSKAIGSAIDGDMGAARANVLYLFVAGSFDSLLDFW